VSHCCKYEIVNSVSVVFNLPSLAFVLILIAAGVVFWLLLVCTISWAILTPPRMTDGKALYLLNRLSPADIGLPFERCSFVTAGRPGQSIRIAGWWIPSAHPSRRTVILLHGFADAKVGAIAWARMWHELGFNILSVDLRGHGESGGRYCTGGYLERYDVANVIDDLRLQHPTETERVLLFGISFGGAVALATASLRDDLAGVVVDSPYASYEAAVRQHLRLSRLFDRTTFRPALLLAERFAGADFNAVHPTQLIPLISAPILLIQSDADAVIPPVSRRLLLTAMRDDTLHVRQSLAIDGAPHVKGFHTDPSRYCAAIKSFVDALPNGNEAV